MKKLISILLLSAISAASAQTFDSVSGSVKADLNASIEQLEALKEQIVIERQPLQAEESRLKDSAFALRADRDRILRPVIILTVILALFVMRSIC